ncbi:protein kinase family protein [Sporosarcina obsidiansis]|uniref:protein kinase family protein n=1 Tax=Sporosarcina obsidiansis TaxID=2660748 RepID=UPI001890BEA4|nr:protein kinase family protein [Sporosarcina obsidiansis]
MSNYQNLAKTVMIDKKNRLIHSDESLLHIGTGRSAFVFRISSSDKAIKVFFPEYTHLAEEEAEIYSALQTVNYFPRIYDAGPNYLIIDYIEGSTLFDCVTNGKRITKEHINEIDNALLLAADVGLNPSDIHLRNIFVTSRGEIKLIDVARYRQIKDCTQWEDLKKAYYQFYDKYFFVKKIPAFVLNFVASLYKRRLIPYY